MASATLQRAPTLRRSTAGLDRREAALLGAIVVGGLVVLGLWWADTPATTIHSWAQRLTAIGDITALIGTYLVLVQVVLMARIPALEHLIGGDRLTAWHRKNGAYAISLLAGHAVFTIAGYAVSDRVSLVRETKTMIRSYPDVLAAVVALGMLVVISVLSIRQARRKLRYETWYFIHLYTYIAIALAFSHQLATGNDFVVHPFNRFVWIAFYVATFASLIGYRVVAPVRNSLTHDLRVHSVHPAGSSAVSVYITGHDLDDLGARAGQFFRWRFLSRDAWWQSHPFSLSEAPNDDYFRITAKGVGDHSEELRRLTPGTRVIAEGPLGAMTADRRVRRKVLLIAGGIGITPLRAILEELDFRPGEVTLLYRARFERDIVLRDEIEELARTKGIHVRYVLGSRTSNPQALSPRHILKLVPDVKDHDVYLCGPPGLMDAAYASVRHLGVPRRHIHKERFEL